MNKFLTIFLIPIFLLVFFYIIFYSLIISADPLFNWPLNLPKGLSATLGEIRGLSLHQGIDIRTNGRPGYPVFAAASGNISRIISRENGYGNAVFLNHGNGFESVYGHLDSFEEGKHHLDTLTKILNVLYNNDRLDFRFTQCNLYYKGDEKIAYAGESGSGLPHLHFEIRENNEFLNPLDYIHVRDTESPVIENLFVCVEKNNATVFEKKINVIKRRGIYSAVNNPIEIPGEKIFFKISCYDRVGAHNRAVVYRIKVNANKEKIFEIAFDNLTKNDLKYGPFVYDISRSTILGGASYVYFLCRKDSNDFTGIKTSGDGYINLDDKEKEISILVSDFAGNEVTLKFKITNNLNLIYQDFFSINSKKGFDFLSKDKNIHIIIPENAVYGNTLIKIENAADPEIIDSFCKAYAVNQTDLHDVFSIYPHDTVYKKSIKIFIKKPPGIKEEDAEHVRIFQFFEGKRPNALKTKYLSSGSVFQAESGTNGFFALLLDKTPPKIFPGPTFEFCEDKDIYRKIRLYCSENISRINKDSVQCIIDGEIYPSGFDEDRKWIEVKLPKKAISRGMHHIFAKACDEAKNEAMFRGLLVFE